MKKTGMMMLCGMAAMLWLVGCSEAEEPFVHKSYETDGKKVDEINIDVRDRQIEVELSEDDQVRIDYLENSKEYYDISISDDKVLNMTAASSKGWKDYIGGKADDNSRKIVLQVPDEMLSKLTLKTTNEDIVLDELSVKSEISLSVNGGDITFDKVNVGDVLNLSAKNGDIKGTAAGSYDDFAIDCKIKKGESNLPEHKDKGEKVLNVSNNNGDIDVKFVQAE